MFPIGLMLIKITLCLIYNWKQSFCLTSLLSATILVQVRWHCGCMQVQTEQVEASKVNGHASSKPEGFLPAEVKDCEFPFRRPECSLRYLQPVPNPNEGHSGGSFKKWLRLRMEAYWAMGVCVVRAISQVCFYREDEYWTSNVRSASFPNACVRWKIPEPSSRIPMLPNYLLT